MSHDASEDFLRQAESRPRRGWPWLIAAGMVLAATAFISGKLVGTPKKAISSDDALAYVQAQVKLNEIGQKFNEAIKPIQTKAEADAAPYRKTLVDIQKRVCKANAMTDDCEIDGVNQTVKAKAKAIPAVPLGK